MRLKSRVYQTVNEQHIYDAWESGAQNILDVMPCGSGKCLGKGTPILMFDGTIKNVEDIKINDRLMGPDSKPRNVLSTCKGVEPLYEVIPIKGDKYVVNESHILSLRVIGKSKIVNISVKDYLQKSNNFKNTHKGWRTGVEFTSNPQPIDPYIVGVWLGDGTSRAPEICNVDHEVISAWYAFANNTNCKIKIRDLDRVPMYSIISNTRKHGANKFRNFLKNWNLFNNKHIPHIYKTGDRQQRLEILAGIIDTDGYISHGGCDLAFKHEILANDIVYIARSLGLAAYVNSCIKTCFNTNSSGIYWRIYISGDLSIIPCKVARRKSPKRKQIKNVLNTGIKLNPIGEGEYYGFEIDSDRLFMLGDFTVTHNTKIFSDIIEKHDAPACAIAHRQELVGQISLALARNEIRHKIIGPKKVIRMVNKIHMDELGKSYYQASAAVGVAGVDTLTRGATDHSRWLKSCTLWVQDEAHHILRANKWGKAAAMFTHPNIKGLGVTATAERADYKGLGRKADGIIDVMVEGPTSRQIINKGFLTDYRVYNPKSDFDRSNIPRSDTTGDFTQAGSAKAVRNDPKIIGDIVKHYKRIAPGKLGITFVPSVDIAEQTAREFYAAGVPSAVVHAGTPDNIRIDVIRQFRNRELLQLVNVDLFGEGFDLPAIEVVQMARPTDSYPLYHQQFMRALRLMISPQLMQIWDTLTDYQRLKFISESEKPFAIIIDHVNNIDTERGGHGLPDAARIWSLDARDKRARKNRDDVIPTRTCIQCTDVYERIYKVCPTCGFEYVPADRSSPEFVDGDLTELDPITLAVMRGELDRVNMSPEAYKAELASKYIPIAHQMSNVKHHVKKQQMQSALRASIAWWAGYQHSLGRSDEESYKRFYFMFGIDVFTAQTLKTKDAEVLAGKINYKLGMMAT